jgi:hypothetical protein
MSREHKKERADQDDAERRDLQAYLAGLRAEGGGRAATEEESREMHPERETRPTSEKISFPDYSERKRRERDGRE